MRKMPHIAAALALALSLLGNHAQGANIKGAQGHFEGDRFVDDPNSITPPPGNLCIFGGQECIARDGWHLEKDRAYGGSIAIHDGANETRTSTPIARGSS